MMAATGHVKHVTAIGEVLGDGAKTTAVAIEYDAPILNSSLSAASYTVDGRKVKRVYTNSEAMKSRSPHKGRFVIVELKTTVSLTPDFGPDMKKDNDKANDPKDKEQGGGPAGGITAGNRPTRESNPFPITAALKQAKAIKTTTGKTYKAGATLTSDKSRTLIADDFKQLTFKDSKTGVTLRYNLFVPQNYDASKRYPLVLFMHDASGANQNDNYTLLQGNGATVWASPRDQAKHPCFVLAPQYDEIVVDDSFRVTPSAETTIDLLDYIKKQYSVDANRVYTTGQSMGCMMSYLLMSKHPSLFAAGYLVAGHWRASDLAPMSTKPLWLVSSAGKSKEGAEEAIAEWQQHGGVAATAEWPLTATDEERDAATAALLAQGGNIHYSHLTSGSHFDTWRVAYGFRAIRDWLFSQHK